MSYGMISGALSRGRETRIRTIFALAVAAAAVLALTLGATNAGAAFVANGYTYGASNSQAGSHPAITLTASNNAAEADKNGDDLRTLQFDLPAGTLLNPKAVPTPCLTNTFKTGTCPAATQVGTVSVSYRVGSTTYTSTGSVFSITPDADSLVNLGFVVGANSKFQKLLFVSGKAVGLTTVRQGLDKDYGLSISVPDLPRKIKSNLGIDTNMTISNVSVTLNGRSAWTSYPVPSFTTAPTRCDAANSAVKFTSYLNVTATRTATYTPTGCNLIKSDPSFEIAATNTRAGQATGMSSTVYVPDADADLPIQHSHIKSIAVDLEKGTTVNLSTLNAVTLCTEAQLSSDTCPAASKIGTASVAVPLLVGSMTGEIYLTSRDTIQFGYVLRGSSGTKAILRGSVDIVTGSYTGGGLRANFQTLPQVPWTSANLNFTSKLVNNPKNSCPNASSWAEIRGYANTAMLHGAYYAQTGCPPDTTITSAMPGQTRLRQPTFTFTSTPSGATFECQIDYAGYAPCASGFKPAALTDGQHTFGVRAVYDGVNDPSPAQYAFTVDATPPTINVSSPAQNAVLTTDAVTVQFTTEPGATDYCWIDSGALARCTSPTTFAGLADGAHELTVFSRDALGNFSSVVRDFTVATPKLPVVTLTDPVNQGTTVLDSVTPKFTYSSPSGTAITKVTCQIFVVYYQDYEYEDGPAAPCKSGDTIGLTENDKYRLQIEVTDANGLVGIASATFITGIRPPSPASVIDADDVGAGRITDRTPSFRMSPGDDRWPNITYDCSLTLESAAPVWKPCGTRTNLPPYEVTQPLADGEWSFKTRAVSGDIIGWSSGMTFTVGPWAASYAMTPSTTAAGAHPDLDVQITPTAAGQLRAVDLLFPKGLIGSLNSFPKCAAANVATANCSTASQMGTVDVDYQIAGLSNLRPTDGVAFFTEPQVAGDAAGLVIRVNSPVDPFADVIIPMRVQLTNNSQQMRIFSDMIPTVVGDVNDPNKFTNFWVNDFKMHVDGSKGSPQPLLTNPSSCAASRFTGTFGDIEGNKTPAQTIPFQATECASLSFAPTLNQTFSNLVATQGGSVTGVNASLTLPAGNSTIRRVTVLEPSVFGPNLPSFGSTADRCMPNAIVDTDPTSATNYVFTHNATLCPASARVGTLSIVSPLLTRPLVGEVYLVEAGSLPRFGVKVDQDGVSLRLASINTVVSDTCDEEIFDAGCPDQVKVDFDNIPDLPLSSFDLNLDETSRASKDGTKQLSSKLLNLQPSYDTYNCRPSTTAKTTITSWSGVTRVLQQAVPITGCDTP